MTRHIVEGHDWFGAEVIEKLKKIEEHYTDERGLFGALVKLRRQVRKTLGIDKLRGLSEEKVRRDLSRALQYGDPSSLNVRGFFFLLNIYEGSEYDGLAYVAEYRVGEGRVTLNNVFVVIPDWWVK